MAGKKNVAKKDGAMKRPAAKKPAAMKKPAGNEKDVFNEDLMECRSQYVDMVDYNASYKCPRACTWKEQLALYIGTV